jgi:hypothetical protein
MKKTIQAEGTPESFLEGLDLNKYLELERLLQDDKKIQELREKLRTELLHKTRETD